VSNVPLVNKRSLEERVQIAQQDMVQLLVAFVHNVQLVNHLLQEVLV